MKRLFLLALTSLYLFGGANTAGAVCTTEVITSPSQLSASELANNADAKAFKASYDAFQASGKGTFSDTITKVTCPGQSPTYSTKLTQAQTAPLPSLFDGDHPNCEVQSDQIYCSSTSAAVDSNLRLPICELFEQAVASKKSDKIGDYTSLACSELVDPLPANYFSDGTVCISKNSESVSATGVVSSLLLTFKNSTSSDTNYCNAILTSTGQGFGGLFGIIRLIYDISLPVLIALAVISLVGVGVFIMFAPNGGEDTMKKAKAMAIRIFAGFMLLLFLRVFLSLISFDLFGIETPAATTTSSTK